AAPSPRPTDDPTARGAARLDRPGAPRSARRAPRTGAPARRGGRRTGNALRGRPAATPEPARRRIGGQRSVTGQAQAQTGLGLGPRPPNPSIAQSPFPRPHRPPRLQRPLVERQELRLEPAPERSLERLQ